jgi:hypothetical protein
VPIRCLNRRDFPLKAGQSQNDAPSENPWFLQDVSGLNGTLGSAAHAEGRGFESLQPLPLATAFSGRVMGRGHARRSRSPTSRVAKSTRPPPTPRAAKRRALRPAGNNGPSAAHAAKWPRASASVVPCSAIRAAQRSKVSALRRAWSASEATTASSEPRLGPL